MQDNAIDAPRAPFMVRIASMVYESLLVVAVVFVASFLILPVVGEMRAPWQRHLFQGYLASVLFGYFAAFWLRSGQTLAMKTWRLRLVDRNGSRISFRQAVVRFLVALVGLPLGGLTLWWAWFDRDRQFLHDRIAGTRLIRIPRSA